MEPVFFFCGDLPNLFRKKNREVISSQDKTVQIVLSDILAKLQYATFDFEFIIFARWLENTTGTLGPILYEASY